MSRVPERLDGGSVALRRRDVTDLPGFIDALRSSWAELAAWFPWAQGTLDEAEQRQRVVDAEAAFRDDSDYEFVMLEGSTDVVVGSLRLNPSSAPYAAEIGYWVRSDRTGRGYATAATRVATQAAFEHLVDVDRVLIQMDVANRASAAIPRKLEYRLEAEDDLAIEAPARTGRGYLWVMTRELWIRGGLTTES